MKLSEGIKRESEQAYSNDDFNVPQSLSGIYTPGNKSDVIDTNRGISLIVNLGIFTS